MGITIRPVTCSADYVEWRQVFMAVLPDERAPTVGELAAQAGPSQRYVLAEFDGTLAGSGVVGKSSLAGQAFVAPRVLPACRRRGIGSAVLRWLARDAAAMGFTIACANAADAGSACFAERHGFREVDRQVEQVRAIGDEQAPQAPPGVTIVAMSARPELWLAAYDTVGRQAFQDMPTVAVLEVTPEQWQRDWMTDPDAMFVAVADGEVIGCAGLMPDPDKPRRAEHALTAVRRDWRRRGVASALKRTTLVWAAANGYTEVYTWTQRDNDQMRALNAHLGFRTRSQSITMQAALPLPDWPAGAPQCGVMTALDPAPVIEAVAGDQRLRVFVGNGQIAVMPARQARRRLLLDKIAQAFEPGMRYPERDVNAFLGAIHPDYAALRRYLVDDGFLARAAGVYWRSGGTVP